jgi:hypothetical protein
MSLKLYHIKYNVKYKYILFCILSLFPYTALSTAGLTLKEAQEEDYRPKRVSFYEERPLPSTVKPLKLYKIQVEREKEQEEEQRQSRGNAHSYRDDPFVQEELRLIQDKEFTLWGIGLFAGSDVVSAGIRKLTGSYVSHCALILSDQYKQRYCFESTGSANDILYRHILPQVQIHLWEDLVNNYSGGIWSREFTFAEGKEPNTKRLSKYVKKNVGKPYEKDLSKLIEAVTKNKGQKAKKHLFAKKKYAWENDPTASIFCSELVADCLIKLHILRPDRQPENYLPRDFTTEWVLHLEDGITLSEEKLIKAPANSSSCCMLF